MSRAPSLLCQNGEEEISPSTLFAVASILEGSSYINGSPQNTFVPGVIELAERHKVRPGQHPPTCLPDSLAWLMRRAVRPLRSSLTVVMAVAAALLLVHQVYIGGDDFKSGQTKMKSVLVDFLVSAGIKPTSIVSYNHLGNNDGKNLSAPQTFRSKVRGNEGRLPHPAFSSLA